MLRHCSRTENKTIRTNVLTMVSDALDNQMMRFTLIKGPGKELFVEIRMKALLRWQHVCIFRHTIRTYLQNQKSSI